MKIYIVTEYGGEWEDAYELPVVACKSKELAEKAKIKLESARNDCKISSEKWDKMYAELEEVECEGDIYPTIEDGMLDLFPEYTLEDIKQAMYLYDTYDNYIGIQIKEVSYAESDDDVNKIINEYRN